MEKITVSNIDREKLVVTQANQLATASYSLTLEEKRLVLVLMSLVRKEDKDFHEYRIPIVEIREFLGFCGKDFYGRLRNVAKTLRSRPLSIEKPSGGWIETGWISHAEYKPKGEDGLDCATLELSFDPRMKPFLLQLKKQFFSFMLTNVANLRSVYSIRFYEIFSSYKNIKTISFEVADLKKRLHLDHKYKRYDDFRKRVILTAQRELKEKTDICFKFNENKKGRRVNEIHFEIFTQNIPEQKGKEKKDPVFRLPKPPENQPFLIEPSGDDKEKRKLYEQAVQKAIHNGLTEKAATKLLSGKNLIHALENIELATAAFMRSKKADKNLAALTVHFVQNDLAAEKREEREKKEALIKAREDEKIKKEKEEERCFKFEKERMQIAVKIYSDLEKSEQERIFNKIRSNANSIEAQFIDDNGEDAFMFKVKMVKEIKHLLPTEFQDYKKWCDENKA